MREPTKEEKAIGVYKFDGSLGYDANGNMVSVATLNGETAITVHDGNPFDRPGDVYVPLIPLTKLTNGLENTTDDLP